jgi:DNA-binding NarL/FixJ family response regulator
METNDTDKINYMNNSPSLVLVDDHSLLRNALARTIATDLGYPILYQCRNGRELKEWLTTENEPDIIIMDINMPEMDGYESTLWLKKRFPLIKVIALSMSDDETSIIRRVLTKGFYYSELVSGSLLHSINDDDDDDTIDLKKVLKLKGKDVDFLKLVCTEMTYKEIAEKMLLSPRTIDGYRDELFQRLGVKSRVGLVLFAIKNGVAHF